MCSGSAFVAEVLRRYFGAALSARDVAGYFFSPEQNITRELLDEVAGKTFALDLHVRPYAHNLQAARDNDIDIVLLWRNLADTIVAYDEQLRSDSDAAPAFFLADRERYAKLRAEERYAFLIDTLVPQNLGFYLAWRRQHVPIYPYERLVESPQRFVSLVVTALAAHADEERIAAILSRTRAARTDLDGADAAAERFSAANRRHLERVVMDHPQRHELEVLLWELPWEVPVLRSASPHDGKLVGADGPALFFISRGIRRLVPDLTWITARRRLSVDGLTRVSADELDRIPEGDALA